MFRASRLLIAMTFVLVIYAGILAPAFQKVIKSLEPLIPSSGVDTGIVGTTETVMFLGIPLIFGGGIVLVFFLIAVRLRGTSFQ